MNRSKARTVAALVLLVCLRPLLAQKPAPRNLGKELDACQAEKTVLVEQLRMAQAELARLREAMTAEADAKATAPFRDAVAGLSAVVAGYEHGATRFDFHRLFMDAALKVDAVPAEKRGPLDPIRQKLETADLLVRRTTVTMTMLKQIRGEYGCNVGWVNAGEEAAIFYDDTATACLAKLVNESKAALATVSK